MDPVKTWTWKLRATIFIQSLVLFCSLHSFECRNIESGSDDDDKRFYPSENDEDYRFPKYPFQQYIQVRKSYTVEHVPYTGSGSGSSSDETKKGSSPSSSSDSLVKSASSHYGNSHRDEDPDKPYYQPPLREEITEKKKQEVYEERGYSDGHYDHASHGESVHGYEPQPHPHYDTSASAPSSSSSASSSGSNLQPAYSHSQPTKKFSSRFRSPKQTVGGDEGSSTRILKYIADNLYDKDAHAVGFYKARSHIYCPEVIDFDLSSKSQGMGEGQRPQGKKRLNGLGGKIECLKNKYFASGSELLPSAVFLDPKESQRSTIKMGTMNDFLDEIKQYFHYQ